MTYQKVAFLKIICVTMVIKKYFLSVYTIYNHHSDFINSYIVQRQVEKIYYK